MNQFEKLGKIASQPLKLVILIMIPFLFILFTFVYWIHEQKKVNNLEERWLTLHEAARKTLPQRYEKKKFLDHFSKADRHFIAHKLEKISCLNEEKDLTEKIYTHPIFSQNKEIAKRYHFLTQENFLSFSEEEIIENAKFWEVIAKQKQPIEIIGEDLEKILALIEYQPMQRGDIDPTSPHMIIKHLDLNKTRSQNYALSMEVIHREYK